MGVIYSEAFKRRCAQLMRESMTQTIKIDSDTVEVDGEVYRKVEKKGPWPFRPRPDRQYPFCYLAPTDRYFGMFDGGSEPHFFPNMGECDKAIDHLHRVLKSMRLYENAKAEGKLDELWYVNGCTVLPAGVVGFCRGSLGHEESMKVILGEYAQAGRVFATQEEAEESL